MGILDGKVVIVTGSARGMGAAEALDAAENGAEVIVTDILDERGNETAIKVGATYRSLDVTSKENWSEVVSSVLDEYGRIDGLVNNAGIYTSQDIFSGSADTFKKVIEVNQFGTYLGMAAVTPIMSVREAEVSSIFHPLRGCELKQILPIWQVSGLSEV